MKPETSLLQPETTLLAPQTRNNIAKQQEELVTNDSNKQHYEATNQISTKTIWQRLNCRSNTWKIFKPSKVGCRGVNFWIMLTENEAKCF